MYSVCSSLRFVYPQCRSKNPNLFIFIHSSEPRTSFISCTNSSSSSKNDESSVSIPKQIQVDYDPSEDFFGLDVDILPRNFSSEAPKQKSWFGPNGQYIKELPCPSCRGRGYTPCTECNIERSRVDCSQCNGKGMRTCQQCLGECVIWEEAIDERPWERARSISPLIIKEDDDVDKLDIKLDVIRKSKRVYQSPPPEVGLKISRSLKSLNAKTGLFSKHMKILHRDPKLHAQRVAAIKKAKGTDAARKRASEASTAFFRDPENRRRRSISMKGVKFYCSNCGREGHRRNYCPEIITNSSVDRRFKCRLCGQRGHNQRTCSNSSSIESKTRVISYHHCQFCGQSGHNRRTCPQASDTKPSNDAKKGLIHHCSVCSQSGHNRRTCPQASEIKPSNVAKKSLVHHCRVCGQSGHNRRTCPQAAEIKPSNGVKKDLMAHEGRHYSCRICHAKGHNVRTCPQAAEIKPRLTTPERRHYSCGLCYGKGHNIRTCPSGKEERIV